MVDRAATLGRIQGMAPTLKTVRAEIGQRWDDEQAAIAVASPVWRSLLAMGSAAPDDGLVSLSALWEAAGSPPALEPVAHCPAGDRTVTFEGTVHITGEVVHREGRVFGDFETAAWYAQELDPERIEEVDVANLVY